jgi:hypothetical protein
VTDAIERWTVVVRTPAGEIRISPAAFLDLPLDERVGLVLQRHVTFLHDGVAVEMRTALRSLAHLVGAPEMSSPNGREFKRSLSRSCAQVHTR